MKYFKSWKITAGVLIIIPLLIIFVKILYFEFDFKNIIPDKGYALTLDIVASSDKPRNIKITTFAPMNNFKQTVLQEEGISDVYSFKLNGDNTNRAVTWSANRISGEYKMQYNARIKASAVRFQFSPETKLTRDYPESVQAYLGASDMIQTNSETIRRKMEELTTDKFTIYDKIKAIHDFIMNDITYVNFSGGLDAESALLLQEASCNGKSRLYVAMVRELGIPARLVGGVVLNSSPKKTTHQWLEIYINNQWVPFCPTNNHFAELPKNYITLYYDDKVLFNRTSGIGFDYSFRYENVTVPKDDVGQDYNNLPLNIFSFMENFDKFNMSIDVFIYLLMLPLAALVSVILKNIMGLETFGTFLPILIASVLDSTGVVTGLLVFTSVIIIVYFVNVFITRLEILYQPKMAILLSSVILTMLMIFSFGIKMQNYHLVYVVYFPVAILAITINRVLVMIEESSLLQLTKVYVNTVIVVLVSYYFINSTFLQLLMLSFPELILMIIGLNILVGRWAGFRLTEFFRFSMFYKD